MTTHRRFQALAAQAIDFELASVDRELLAAHLASCPSCRRGVERLRGDTLAIATLPRIAPAAGMRERFETRWLPRAGARGERNLRLLLVVAAVLTIGGGVIVGAGIGAIRTPTPTDATPAAQAKSSVGDARSIPVSAGAAIHQGRCTFLAGGSCATDVLVGLGYVWTTATDGLVRLDEPTGKVKLDIPLGAQPIRLATDGRLLWVTTQGPSAVKAIDPATGEVTKDFRVDGLPAGIVAADNALWVVDSASRSLHRMDQSSGGVTATIDVGDSPWEVAATVDSLWVSDRTGTTLTHVDLATATFAGTYSSPDAPALGLRAWGDGVVVDDDMLYLAASDTIASFDRISETFGVLPAPSYSHLAAADGRVWSVAGNYGLLQELDSHTLRPIASQLLGNSGPSMGGDWETSIAAGHTALWIRDYENQLVVRIAR